MLEETVYIYLKDGKTLTFPQVTSIVLINNDAVSTTPTTIEFESRTKKHIFVLDNIAGYTIDNS